MSETDVTGGPAEADRVLAGGGELGARMRAMDWATTPLGPVADWPRALKTAVRIMLTSRQPMFVWWGPQLINLYNDAYTAIVGGKHPAALGQPAATVWREIWDQVGPRAESALRGDEGTYDEALLLIMERHGYPEETYYTFSYSPVPDDDGAVGGILCANTDDTQRIIGERQLTLLRELASTTSEARTIADACAAGARGLATNLHDLPFALVYLVEPEQRRATLAGSSNMAADATAAPETLDLDAGAPWPVAEALRSQADCLVCDLDASCGPLPSGAWDRPPRQAAILPIARSGETGQAGALVVGLNPYRLFGDDYRRFLGLVAGQIAAAVANAQAYEEERRRAEALAEIDRAKTAFFSNVSHEFRTPLTLMLGPLDDLLSAADGALPAAQRAELRVVRRNGQRLLRLVNTLLDFSRIEAGRTQASYEPTDLPGLTADLASTFRSAIERAGLRLAVDCPPLPPGAEVYVDREMWEKIVLNLLSNAFKFTFEGEIGVATRLADAGRTIELVVRDSGVGIPAVELPRLFERFHRVQGARARTHEGTGIGLALVEELVKLHGGTVGVASEPGRGTTFTVALPTGAGHLPPERIQATRELASTALGAAPYVEEATRWLPGAPDAGASPDGLGWDADERAASPRPDGQLGRVLLADDNADMREYVARLLAGRYAVEAVADGRAALAAALARPPDLVLSDVMMPELDGFGLLRALRDDDRTGEVPVILLSARAGEEARVEGLQAGADDYLVKPFSSRELLARVDARLELARLRADATARERAARAEAEAERARLREWLMQAPALIAILRGPEHVFAGANEGYAELVGHRELIGRTVAEALPEVAEQGFVDLLDRVYRDGEPYVGLETPVHLNASAPGDWQDGYLNFVYQPIRDAAGQPEGIFVHAVDVTDMVRARQRLEEEIAERQRAEGVLADQRGVLELIARGAPLGAALEALIGLIEADGDGLLCSILLLDREGRQLRHGAAPNLPEAYNRAIDGLAIGPCAGSCGTAAFRGETVEVEDIAHDPLWADFKDLALAHGLGACWSTPIRGQDGRVLGTFAIYHREPRSPSGRERQRVATLAYLASVAIERHRAEEERVELLERERAARGEAEEAVRARDEFLSIAAHELRTPVTAIKGTAQLALRAQARGALDNERAEKALRTVNLTADRLATLTNDLLDVSRVQGGQLALRPERVDLAALVRGVVERCALHLQDEHILDADLPDAAVAIDADAGRLEQVFDNLLSNAIKYSPAGGAIEVTLERAADGAMVAVRDTGIGLPAGTTERIFEPFGRAANAAAQNLPGMGLGLYISRRIVELHGGRLWAESDGEGRGTTMRTWLPTA